MADGFFPNEMPDSVEESVEEAEAAKDDGDLLAYHLLLPYRRFTSSALLDAGLLVVHHALSLAWTDTPDYTLWTGKLGTAYLLLKSFLVKNSRSDLEYFRNSRSHLERCVLVTTTCDIESFSKDEPGISFISGRAGVCAIGAVAAKYLQDELNFDLFISAFHSIKIPTTGTSSELIQGRAGYLWTCLFLNKHLGCHTVNSDYMLSIAKQLIREGRSNPDRGDIPLMYKDCGMNYYGGFRGVSGILHVLMDMHLDKEERGFVKGTLKYMIQHRLSNGNYPAAEQSLDEEDIMARWCDGAPGFALTLVKAFQVFQDKEFLTAAEKAAQAVWKRGLLKLAGLCDGISGNAYVFLALYRATGRMEYLYKAKAFAAFLITALEQKLVENKNYLSDLPVSLFEGVGGMGYLFLDMVNPMESRFPGYEL